MRYVTDFSSESFGMYVGIIYISKLRRWVLIHTSICIPGDSEGVPSIILIQTTVKGVEELANNLILSLYLRVRKIGIQHGLESWLSWYLRRLRLCREFYIRGRSSHLLRVQISTIFWVGFSHIPGNLKSTHISFVPITRAFYPTQPRGWLVQFWELDTKWIFAALPFGFLTMLLFYYDHVSKHRA